MCGEVVVGGGVGGPLKASSSIKRGAIGILIVWSKRTRAPTKHATNLVFVLRGPTCREPV